jgi:RNA polymerase sigma factor (TIGR02999 family)
MNNSLPVPYVVGQWVRGDRFYGRASQLGEILEGPRDSFWLLGTRRVGKTSLLKQLEQLAVESPERGYLPLFWDFQGSAEPEELHLGFHDAVLDAEERLAGVGVDLEKVEASDLFASLGYLRRHLRSKGLKLLVLCDEVEELIKLQRQDPSLLRKLRRAMQWGEEIRSVLTSTIRLWALAEERGDTSPFLHGFTPPLYLAPLEDEEARSLLRQEQLATESRPSISDEGVEEIRSRCDNHPYLLQLVGKRYVETGDLKEALEQVAADDMVSHFFAVDYEMLSASEQGILRTIAAESAASSGSMEERLSVDRSQLTGGLLRLESLGFIRRGEERRFELRNHFFRRWLRRATREAEHRSPTTPPTSGTDLSELSQRITDLLTDLEEDQSGRKPSPQELLDLVYDELHDLARRYMSRERPNHTLQPTALVHEAYLKLVDQTRVSWQGRTHFLAVGANLMRRILIDHARGHRRAKRGGDWLRVTFLDGLLPSPEDGLSAEQIMDLDRALEELAALDERQAKIVELRFFGGLNVAEVAASLGVSKRTVETDWARARDWLKQHFAKI